MLLRPGTAIMARQRSHRSSSGMPIAVLQRFGDSIGAIRVGDHGSLEFVGRPGEGRENEHAGVIGALCSDILLGDQVRSVAQRSDKSRAAEPKETSQRALGKAPVQVLIGAQSSSAKRPATAPASAPSRCRSARYSGTPLRVAVAIRSAPRRLSCSRRAVGISRHGWPFRRWLQYRYQSGRHQPVDPD